MSEFHDQLQAFHQRSDRALLGYIAPLPFNEGKMVEAMRHGALLGGKRLRPFLVYATGQMFGLSLENLDAPAAAVECIHAYSLIHDDLPAMDDDDLRRGQPTCHIKFGEANAILAGDALQTLAFSILADADMPDVALRDRLAMISELAKASGVAAGEPGRAALPELDRYAAAIGLAFQVQDDILDVVGETEKIGKRQGSDQQLGKSTYPALLGLDSAKLKAWDLYQEALAALDSLATQSYNTAPLRALANFIIERDN